MNINPLEVIGLTPKILYLGLSQDGLYEWCQDVAKKLLFQVHPDRNHGDHSEEMLHVREAWEMLKDRRTFDDAVAKFRLQRRYENHETKTLRERIQALDRENKDLRAMLDKAQKSQNGHTRSPFEESFHESVGDVILDIEAAAARLHTSKDWLYRHWRTLPFAFELSPKQIRFSAQGIDEFIRKKRT